MLNIKNNLNRHLYKYVGMCHSMFSDSTLEFHTTDNIFALFPCNLEGFPPDLHMLHCVETQIQLFIINKSCLFNIMIMIHLCCGG